MSQNLRLKTIGFAFIILICLISLNLSYATDINDTISHDEANDLKQNEITFPDSKNEINNGTKNYNNYKDIIEPKCTSNDPLPYDENINKNFSSTEEPQDLTKDITNYNNEHNQENKKNTKKKLSNSNISNSTIIIMNTIVNRGTEFKIKLVNNNGNPLNSKIVKFNIVNKTYSKITNSEGIASLIIRLKLGTYEMKVNFQGTSTIQASSIDTNITVIPYKLTSVYSLDDLLSASTKIKNHIENHHQIPKNIILSGENITIEQSAALLANAIININNNDNTSIYLSKVPPHLNSNENINEGLIEKTDYINLFKSLKNIDTMTLIPTYFNSSIGQISFENTVYLAANILDSYLRFNKLPTSSYVNPWAKITDNNTKFISIDEIFSKSAYIQNHVENKHKLPNSLNISLVNESATNINMAQMLDLEVKTLAEFNCSSSQSIILESITNASSPSESITGGNLDYADYLEEAISIIDFIKNNNMAPNFANTIKGSIRFESLVYLYSQIIVSIHKYEKCPDTINLVPWTQVKNQNTKFISMDDILNISTYLKEYLKANNHLPTTLNYSKGQIPLSQFLYPEVKSIKNINNNLYQSILLINYSSANNPIENTNRGKILKSNYITVADNIINFLANNNYAPNYATFSLGTMRYENYIHMYSEVLDFFNSNGHLPEYVIINPWSKITNNPVYFTESQVINTSKTVVDHIESNHNLPSSVNIGNHNINIKQFLKLELSTLNFIDKKVAGELMLDNFTSPTKTESLISGILLKNDYLNLSLLMDYDMYYNDALNEQSHLGNISLNSAVYAFSQILSSYKNLGKLPEFINIKPWNLISNSNTKFASITDIINSSKNLKAEIESDRSIPSNVQVKDYTVTAPNFLKIASTAIAMIYGDLDANLAIETYSLENNISENISYSNVDKETYVGFALQLMNQMDSNKKVPKYLQTSLGNIRYESLLYLFSSTLSKFEENDNLLINSTVLLSWNTLANNPFFTRDDVIECSNNLKEHIETYRQLPSNVCMNGSNLTIAQYLQIASECLLNINGDLHSQLTLKPLYPSFINNESLQKSFDINSAEYIGLVNDLNEYLSTNKKLPNNLLHNLEFQDVYLGINSLTYLVAEIFSSYNHFKELPPYLNYKPWAMIANSSTILLSEETILNISWNLEYCINNTHSLPENMNLSEILGQMDGEDITINNVQLMDLFTTCFINIDSNVYQSVKLNAWNDFNDHYENIIGGELDHNEYISLIQDLADNFKEDMVTSNLSDISLGDNIGFNTLLLMESQLLNEYAYSYKIYFNKTSNDTNVPMRQQYHNKTETPIVTDYIPESIVITPWIVVSNPNKIYNYRNNKIYDSINAAIHDKDTLNGDYIAIGKSLAGSNAIINKSVTIVSIPNFNATVTSSLWTKPVFTINYENVTIEDLKFMNFFDFPNINDNCISILVNSSHCEISNCEFHNFNKGIYLNNSFNEYLGFNKFNNTLIAIDVSNSSSIDIEANKFSSNNTAKLFDGIKISNSTDISIYGNVFKTNDFGLDISDSQVNCSFNSILSSNGVKINTDKLVNLTNNWWGTNSADSQDSLLSNSILLGNVLYDSFLVLNMSTYVDYSSYYSNLENDLAYDVVVSAIICYNNKSEDLSKEYNLDLLNMTFVSNGVALTNLTNGGSCSVTFNGTTAGNTNYSIILDNFFITGSMFVPPLDHSNVYNNRTHESFKTINDAIASENTLDGDLILVNEGIYRENPLIYKNITLLGNGTVFVYGNGSNSTIKVFSNGATIRGFNFIGDEDSYGISVFGIGINITNNTFKDFSSGIFCLGSINTSICDNSFTDNEYAIYSSSSENTSISNNRIISNSYGIYGSYDNDMLISSNDFKNWIDINLVYETGPSINNNYFNKSYLGAEIIMSENVSLSENVFESLVVGFSSYNSTLSHNQNIFNHSILSDYSSFDDEDIVLQKDMWTCGSSSIMTIFNKLELYNFNLDMIINATSSNSNGTSMFDLYHFLRENNFSSFGLRLGSDSLKYLDLVLLNISGDLHYSVIFNITEDFVVLGDSSVGLVNISRSSFDDLFSGLGIAINDTNLSGRKNTIILENAYMATIYGTWAGEDVWVALNQEAFRIPYYENLDKLGWAGLAIKGILEFTLGINEHGGVSWLDLGIDVVSVLTFGSGAPILRAVTEIKEIFKVKRISKFFDGIVTTSNLVSKFEKAKKIVNNNLINYASNYLNVADTILGFVNNPLAAPWSFGYEVLKNAKHLEHLNIGKFNLGKLCEKFKNTKLGQKFLKSGVVKFVDYYLDNPFRRAMESFNLPYNFNESIKQVTSFVSSSSKQIKATINKINSGNVAKKVKLTVKSVLNKVSKSPIVKSIRKYSKTIKKSSIKKVVKKVYGTVVHHVKTTYHYVKRTVKKTLRVASRYISRSVKGLSKFFRIKF